MSELTFNIADYRPRLNDHPQRNRGEAKNTTRGFVVLTTHQDGKHIEMDRLHASPGVVDIRSIREANRPLGFHVASYPRQGKVLRFANQYAGRVCTMTPQSRVHTDEDPDPSNFPSAA